MVKVKFFPFHAMKAYRGSRGIAQLSLNLGIRLRWVDNFRKYPGTFSVRGWVGPEANLDVLEKRKTSCPYGIQNIRDEQMIVTF